MIVHQVDQNLRLDYKEIDMNEKTPPPKKSLDMEQLLTNMKAYVAKKSNTVKLDFKRTFCQSKFVS